MKQVSDLDRMVPFRGQVLKLREVNKILGAEKRKAALAKNKESGGRASKK
jgi:hypothetical protein